MPDTDQHAESIGGIAQRIRQRELQRQLRHNEARKAAVRGRAAVRTYLAQRVQELGRGYLETLLGSLLGFFVIAELLAHLAGVNGLYTYSAFGLVYSLQSTYYKHKLAVDPGFKIPSCRCAGRRLDGSEGVLASRQSTFLGIPNSVLAAAFFCAVLVLTAGGASGRALPLAAVAVVASGYLSYVMLARLRSLCATCINIASLTALILWQLASAFLF